MSNELFKNKYRIKSARATWCKYNEGKYFITICTKDKIPFFGKISEQNMILSDIGKIAAECMTDLLKHFHNITIPYYVVMPNHDNIRTRSYREYWSINNNNKTKLQQTIYNNRQLQSKRNKKGKRFVKWFWLAKSFSRSYHSR